MTDERRADDEALDREFAYTSYAASCKDLYGVDQLCRRAHQHLGDHASGFGAGRVRWSA